MKKLAYCAIAAAALAVGLSNAALAANKGKPPIVDRAMHTRDGRASPAAFPSSTTIYIIPGVRDDGGGTNAGIATTVNCTNVSGIPVNIRVLAFNYFGDKKADETYTSIAHTQNLSVSTHFTAFFTAENSLSTGPMEPGVIDIEATNAAVFCAASVEDAATTSASGWDLHMVRVNAAPGTQE
jgi:hypothetical protein